MAIKKTLCTSVNALCDKKGVFNPKLESVLLSLLKKYGLFIFSGDIEKKDLLPEKLKNYFCETDRTSIRNGSLLKNSFEKYGTTKKDYVILGSTESDFLLSTHANVLLLASFWSDLNIRVERYGLRIKSPEVLNYFFDNILNIEFPWYYKVDIDDKSKIYSLMSANTKYTNNEDVKEINNNFNNLLKSGNKDFLQLIKYYFICSLNIIEDIHNVKLWDYYPSSNNTSNPILEEFSETARYLFGNSRNKHPLFLRHKSSKKRHYLSKTERLHLGCDSQFETIHLNPKFESYIKGKVVCIIYDYSTYGS